MKHSCAIALLFLFALSVSGQKTNTFIVGSHDLEMHNLQPGNSTYAVYFKNPMIRKALMKTSKKFSILLMMRRLLTKESFHQIGGMNHI